MTILVIVTPDFNSLATMGFIDPFRASNYLEGRALFHWRFVADRAGMCMASNGSGLACDPVEDAKGQRPDIVVMSSSWTPEAYASPRILSALRGCARQGAMIVGLDTGAFIMAQAGLLDGRQATTHYEHIDALQETYPDVDVSEDLFVFDYNRVTCCGGAAAVDVGLHIVEGIHGAALANAAARYVFHPTLRARGTRQQPSDAEPLGARAPAAVKAVIQMMEDHLEDPLKIPEICARVGVSHRQINRLFAEFIKKTPALYYRDIRLDRARGLVTQTDLSIAQVSVASGFSSQVHFSRAYKDRFGLSPLKDRTEGRVPFEFRAWPMHKKPV